MKGVPFKQTPQALSLQRQIANASSSWKGDGLTTAYRLALEFYNEQHLVSSDPQPGQLRVDSITAVNPKEYHMSLEQALVDATAAMTALTAALLKGGAVAAASTDAAAAPAAAKAGKKAAAAAPAAPKNEHTREEMVAVLGEVKEKFNTEAARALFVNDKVAKMAEIPEDQIDVVYAAAKAKLTEEEDSM